MLTADVGQTGIFLVFSFMLMDEIMVTDMTKQGLSFSFYLELFVASASGVKQALNKRNVE